MNKIAIALMMLLICFGFSDAVQADVTVSIPTGLSGTPGSTVTAPVQIDNALGLESVDLSIAYDPAVLQVLALRTGTVTAGGTLVTNPDPVTGANGTVVVGLALVTPRLAGGGTLIEIDYHIRESASPGTTAINLTYVSLNEGGLVINPLPVPGADATDGLITIRQGSNLSGDYNGDCDVDGSDLAALITDSSRDVETFAENFGKSACQY